ncbi:hypothetical protein GQX73_g2387 [Xylaria multiplex]|uniref:Uncharacterized protein n=1 Tax=Xylaria multiplex TaxID=323545 RepID=A0A7C8NB72_9PEZI|nr:hypothetical protein GQX73_g2387 [Xylaria multiplex]
MLSTLARAIASQAYRVEASVPIRWESLANTPLRLQSTLRNSLESDSESDIDMNDAQTPQDDRNPIDGQSELDIQNQPDDQSEQSYHTEHDDNYDSDDIGDLLNMHDEGDIAQSPPFSINLFDDGLSFFMQNDFDQTGFVPSDFFLEDLDAAGIGLPNVDNPSETASEAGDDDDDDDDGEFSGDKVPSISSFRLNLTALSQRYNMYIAAYKMSIHVSRVRSCVDHALPARPDFTFKPPTTQQAIRVGGYIDTVRPHQVNHLVISDLGDEEIMLLAYDDGDVLGYYTSQIDNALLRLESTSALCDSIVVKPFFHENVGVSAWGLAVHKKSRLIAVSNNRHQVHVFALALTDPPHTSPGDIPEILDPHDSFIRFKKPIHGPLDYPGAFPLKIDYDFSHHREYGYCFILDTGEQGNNIPNIAFSNNIDGDAIGILAIDISGKIWVMDIWSWDYTPHHYIEGLWKAHQKSQPSRNQHYMLPRGWGVLVLPASSFLPTSTFQDSLGLSPADAVYVAPQWEFQVSASVKWYDYNLDTYHSGNSGGNSSATADWSSERDEAADRPSEQDALHAQFKNTTNDTAILQDGSSVMRTYEKDIELVGGDQNIGIMFDNAIHQQRPPRTLIPPVRFSPERLSDLLHVPELCLVAAGSLCGRVALITPTKPSNPRYSFKRGFRVEAILPRSSEEDRRLRPICLLYGIAIGPIPSAGGPNGHLLGDRRYRIMLHYYDHRILSYEIYRDTVTSKLCVI